MISRVQFEVIFQQQFAGHLRLSAGSSELQPFQSIFKQRPDRLSRLQRATLSAVENFHFSTTDYCTEELASAREVSLRPPIKGKGVIFHNTHRV